MDIKNLREKLGLTQFELSDITGIPRDRIAKWEQGKGKPKSYDAEILLLLENQWKSIESLVLEAADRESIIKNLRVGIKLKRVREERKVTAEALAALLDIEPISVEVFERGLTDPDTEQAKKLAAWAGIELSEFKGSFSLYDGTLGNFDLRKIESFFAPNSGFRVPGPDASLEQLMLAQRELQILEQEIRSRIDGILDRGKRNSSAGKPESPVHMGSGSKTDKSGKGVKGS